MRSDYMIDNKLRVPMGHYAAKYEAADPRALAVRSGVPYEGGAFHITMLGSALSASWPGFSLSAKQEGCPAPLLSDAAQLLTIRFLLEGVSVPSSGRFLTYREFPWGDVYDANFQGRCVRRLAYAFGNDPESFTIAAKKLGGIALSDGDAAAELIFFEQVKLRLVLFSGDDEFPPSAKFLFSDNASAAFTSEDMAAVGDLVISALKACVVKERSGLY